ncbi:MAG: DUF721 domain-containing protein [Bacteroidales bacterium]|nr:DUF721 domain-containing protein [Bacteroidales bacterium]
MRRNNTEPLKHVLKRFVQAIGGEHKIKEIQLKRNWEELMGKNIAEQTEYMYIKRGVFYIKLRSSVVKHELSMMKSQIVERINSDAGETLINDVVFH